MKFLTPIILIIISVGLFYFYVNPTYSHIKELQTTLGKYNDAVSRAEAAVAKRDELVNTYNNFSSTDMDRLQKMLPDSIDNIRLLVDLDNMASVYSDGIHDISIDSADSSSNSSSNQSVYGTLSMSFNVTMTYTDFQNFLKDIQQSLRIMDISSVSFQPSEKGTYNYNVSLKTYWLK